MNKILFIVLTFGFSARAQTSFYYPLPDSAANWNINYYTSSPLWPATNEYFSITFSSDTTIGTGIYHKLLIPYHHMGLGNCNPVFLGYSGAIRQDVISKKAFFVVPGDTTEQLLYDFNMQVGDTVRGFLEPFQLDIVQSIDSVLIGNNYRKRWNMYPGFEVATIIEGIGSTYSLIHHGFQFSNTNCQTTFTLMCFGQNEITLYPDTISNCGLITGISNPQNLTLQSFVYPNPFHSCAVINSTLENPELRIYNMFGEMVVRKMIIGYPYIIKRDGLINGIYLYQLINHKGKVDVGKFVIE